MYMVVIETKLLTSKSILVLEDKSLAALKCQSSIAEVEGYCWRCRLSTNVVFASSLYWLSTLVALSFLFVVCMFLSSINANMVSSAESALRVMHSEQVATLVQLQLGCSQLQLKCWHLQLESWHLQVGCWQLQLVDWTLLTPFWIISKTFVAKSSGSIRLSGLL